MAHVGSPALYPIKREEEEEEKIRQPRCFRKKPNKQFSFVSTPDVCGAFPTTSNSAALAGVLQFNLILTLCVFLNYCQVPQFKGSVPGDCHWLHMSISGSRSPDYPQVLYDLAINQKFPKTASSGLMYLLEQLLKLREDLCLLVE